MRVLHIIETPGTGGAETVLVDIAAGLPPEFTSVGVMMCESWTGRELAKRGIPVSVLPLRRSFDAGWPVRFAKLIRAQQVDVVQSHEFTANVYATAGARLAGVPIVCTTHGKNYWPHALYRRTAYRWAARSSRAFVAVSKDLGRFVSNTLGIAEGSVRIIRNGIDVDVFKRDESARARVRAELSLKDSQPLVLACGELTEVKGHEWLVRAARLMAQVRPDVLVAIAGDGPLHGHLQSLAISLGITSNVRFLGFRRDIPGLLSAADIFVMPSLSEGLPLAILEAMAAGVPVVATAVGGVPELIRPGDTGWLVQPRNEDELARALLEVSADTTVRSRVAHAAQRLCTEQYALRTTVNAYAEWYRKACGKY